MNELLENRATSGFPISIGTSLALESLFDPIQDVYDKNREVPAKINKNDYSTYIFNVSTIIRNIINTIPSSEIQTVTKDDILKVVLSEIEWLTDFFNAFGMSICFYVNSYSKIKLKYKEEVFRKPNTDKQLYLNQILSHCLDFITKQDDVYSFNDLIGFKEKDNAIIFTHIPYDLLSYKNFIKLDLLESHTGILKTRKDWYSKYYKLPGDRDMSFIPFNKYLLIEVFGDNVMFHPSDLKNRIEVYETLKEKNVHPLMDEFSIKTLLKKE